jgi:hypothetical protein
VTPTAVLWTRLRPWALCLGALSLWSAPLLAPGPLGARLEAQEVEQDPRYRVLSEGQWQRLSADEGSATYTAMLRDTPSLAGSAASKTP